MNEVLLLLLFASIDAVVVLLVWLIEVMGGWGKMRKRMDLL